MTRRFLFALCILLSGYTPLFLFPATETHAGFLTAPEQPSASFESFLQGIGRTIQQTTRRITGRSEPTPRRTTTRTAGTGTKLDVLRSSLAPTVVYKGEKITVTLQYLIDGAPEQGVTIREKSMLSMGGKVLTVLKDETTLKENGVWENTLSFTVPRSAQAGNYVVSLQISTQGQSQTARHTFTLR